MRGQCVGALNHHLQSTSFAGFPVMAQHKCAEWHSAPLINASFLLSSSSSSSWFLFLLSLLSIGLTPLLSRLPLAPWIGAD